MHYFIYGIFKKNDKAWSLLFQDTFLYFQTTFISLHKILDLYKQSYTSISRDNYGGGRSMGIGNGPIVYDLQQLAGSTGTGFGKVTAAETERHTSGFL